MSNDKAAATWHPNEGPTPTPVADVDARAEAERRWPLRSTEWYQAHEGTYTLTGLDAELLMSGNRDGFVAGAEWQASRTPVVADRPTGCAGHYHDAINPPGSQPDCTPAAPALDAEALVRVLRDHRARDWVWIDRQRCECGWRPDTPGRDFAGQHEAHLVAVLCGEQS